MNIQLRQLDVPVGLVLITFPACTALQPSTVPCGAVRRCDVSTIQSHDVISGPVV